MRFFSLILAAVVMATLYLLVFERDAVIAFASGGAAETAELTEETAPETERRVSVVALRSDAQQVDSVVFIRGQTEAARQVDVRAETSGTVISEPLRKGATIEAGQLLCSIDPGTREISLADAKARLTEARARIPEARARLLEAEARVPESEARFQESKARLPEAEARLAEARARLNEAEINQRAAARLAEDGFASETRVAAADAAVEAAKAQVSSAISGVQNAKAGVSAAMAQTQSAKAGIQSAQAGIETAQAGVQSAEAAVAAAQKEIDRLTITAPFGGLLESDTAEIGSLLQPGSPCATIIQLNPIKVVGFVAETEVNRIKVGASAQARLANGMKVEGKVTFLSRSADPLTRTFRVEVNVENADNLIRDGQTAEIEIDTDGVVAHLLPASSLTLNDDGLLGVRTVGEDSRAKFVEVVQLRDTIQGVWLGGLPEHADVIVVGQEFVTDGVAVDVTYREANQ